jgi:hypothetical protein
MTKAAEIVANEVIVVDDRSCLSGKSEVVGPYLDMVCQSTGSGYDEPVVFLIFRPEDQRFMGIVKVIYNPLGRQKYLLFSGFEGLTEESLHLVIKDLNSTPYDFKFFKVRDGGAGMGSSRAVTVTKFLGVNYFRYQQLLASDEGGRLEFAESGGEGDLIG